MGDGLPDQWNSLEHTIHNKTNIEKRENRTKNFGKKKMWNGNDR